MFKPRIKRWGGVWICWACGIATKGSTAKIAWHKWAKQLRELKPHVKA